MSEVLKIPKIRFKNFTESWEKIKIGEILKERNEKASKSNEYPLMAFTSNEGVSLKGERYDRSALINDIENKLYKKTEYGDFIYSSNNLETGSIGVNKYGKATISPIYSVFKPIESLCANFIGNRLIRKDIIFEMIKWRQGVIYGQWKIHEYDFMKIDILVPSVEEQIVIGKYFEYIDDLIKLNELKIEKLKNIKNAMINKMISKNISNEYSIRFKYFKENWVEKKLKELVILLVDGNWIELKDQSRYGIRLIQTGNVGVTEYIDKVNNRKWISEETFKKLNCIEVLPGDILISKLPEPAGRACIVPDLGIKMITVVDCSIVRLSCEFSKKFLVQYLSSQEYFSKVRVILAGGTRKRINKNNLENFKISIPKKYEEQEAIGEYFKYIDDLIKLNKIKLEKFKTIKKAMLEKMFV